jgi:hypothetical protein
MQFQTQSFLMDLLKKARPSVRCSSIAAPMICFPTASTLAGIGSNMKNPFETLVPLWLLVSVSLVATRPIGTAALRPRDPRTRDLSRRGRLSSWQPSTHGRIRAH